MTRNEVIKRLLVHKPDLERFDVKSLALFGSVARDHARDESDVDLLVEFKGVGTSDKYFGLLFFLEDILGRKVELVTRRALRAELRPNVERDLVNVA